MFPSCRKSAVDWDRDELFHEIEQDPRRRQIEHISGVTTKVGPPPCLNTNILIKACDA